MASASRTAAARSVFPGRGLWSVSACGAGRDGRV